MEIKKQRSPQKAPKFINIFEGFIGRYILDKEKGTPYDGLYTDEIGNCRVVIIHGKRSGIPCFSLIHVNSHISADVIKKEREWIEEKCQMILMGHQPKFLPGHIYKQDVLPGASNPSTDKHVIIPEDANAVVAFFDEQGKIAYDCWHTKNKKNIELVNPAKAAEKYAKYLFSISIASLYAHLATLQLDKKSAASVERMKKYLPGDDQLLLYDGTKFTDVQPLVFAGEVEEIYKRLSKISVVSAEQIFHKIIEYLQEKKPSILEEDGHVGVQISATTAAVWFCYLRNPRLLEQSDNSNDRNSANIARRYAGKQELPAIMPKAKLFSANGSLNFHASNRPGLKEELALLKPALILFILAYCLLENKEHSTPVNFFKACLALAFIATAYSLLRKNCSHGEVAEEKVSTAARKKI